MGPKERHRLWHKMQRQADRVAGRPEVITLCPGAWDLMIANVQNDMKAPWLFVLSYTAPGAASVRVALAEWLQTANGEKVCKYGERMWHGQDPAPN